MKKNPLTLLALVAVAILFCAATYPSPTTSPIYLLLTGTDTVPFRARVPAGQTAELVEFVVGATTVFSLPATGIIPATYGGTGAATPAAAKTAFGIQAGTNIVADDGTFTNTFATAFASAPYVVLSGWSDSPTNARLTSVSTTNFIGAGLTNDPLHWIAIGAP